jgi:raffinose/stachyose/melibiose transport system substrate-binding protein
MRAKRAIAVALSVLMLGIGLGGCAGKSDDGGAVYSKTGGEAKEVRFFMNLDDEPSLDILNDAAAKYEADTGVKVTFSNFVQDSNMGSKSYDEVATERIESDSPDDIYILNAGTLLKQVQKGNVEALSGLEGMSDLKQDAITGCSIDGTQYCMPLFMTAYGFYSNTAILKANGLSVPTNLDEFYRCCEVLKAHGVTPFECNKWWTEVLVLGGGMSDFYLGGGSADDLNSGKTAISTYMGKGFDIVSTMNDKGYFDLPGAYDVAPGDEVKDLVAGKTAFCVSMASNISWDYSKAAWSDIAVGGVPVREDGSVVLMNPDLRVCVCSKSTAKDEAMAFLSYLSRPEYTERFTEWQGRYSIRKDAAAPNLAVLKGVNDCISAGRTMPTQNYAIKVEQWDNTNTILWQMMQDGMSATQARAAFDELQATANEQ